MTAALVWAGCGPAAAATPEPAPGSATVTFTHNVTGETASCEVTQPTGIGYPPTQPHQLSWRGVVLCGIQLHMQGTSASYVWGQSVAYYPGSSYDNIATMNETVGRVNVPAGAWGLNNNVLFFVPPDYTATPGTGCASVAAGQVQCTATSGPIMVS